MFSCDCSLYWYNFVQKNFNNHNNLPMAYFLNSFVHSGLKSETVMIWRQVPVTCRNTFQQPWHHSLLCCSGQASQGLSLCPTVPILMMHLIHRTNSHSLPFLSLKRDNSQWMRLAKGSSPWHSLFLVQRNIILSSLKWI